MRQLLIMLAIIYLANGLLMLAAPNLWYQITPGVADTGPINIHFIRDIGLAFVGASGSALLLFSARYKQFAAIAASVIFIGGHGIFHLFEFTHTQPTGLEIMRDMAIIVIPAILFCALMIKQITGKGGAE